MNRRRFLQSATIASGMVLSARSFAAEPAARSGGGAGTVPSFLVVELMRQGRSPEDACREAVERILRRKSATKDLQVGFLAMDRTGHVGAWAIQRGFSYAVCDAAKPDALIPSKSTH